MIIENKNIQPQPKISGSYIKRLHLDETKLISWSTGLTDPILTKSKK